MVWRLSPRCGRSPCCSSRSSWCSATCTCTCLSASWRPGGSCSSTSRFCSRSLLVLPILPAAGWKPVGNQDPHPQDPRTARAHRGAAVPRAVEQRAAAAGLVCASRQPSLSPLRRLERRVAAGPAQLSPCRSNRGCGPHVRPTPGRWPTRCSCCSRSRSPSTRAARAPMPRRLHRAREATSSARPWRVHRAGSCSPRSPRSCFSPSQPADPERRPHPAPVGAAARRVPAQPDHLLRGRPRLPARDNLPLLPVTLALMAYNLFPGRTLRGDPGQIAFFTAALLVCCMVCHGELAHLKPPASQLTSFYLMVALGGALGGLFVAVVSPQLSSPATSNCRSGSLPVRWRSCSCWPRR